MFTAARSILPKQARTFATSARAQSDLARVTLIGRLGADPVRRETQGGKPYFTYSVATQTGVPTVDDQGHRIDPPTSWHTIFAFNEYSHKLLTRVGKGSTVFVEADLEMRPGGNATDGTPLPDRPLLRHQRMNVINRIKPQSETGDADDLD